MQNEYIAILKQNLNFFNHLRNSSMKKKTFSCSRRGEKILDKVLENQVCYDATIFNRNNLAQEHKSIYGKIAHSVPKARCYLFPQQEFSLFRILTLAVDTQNILLQERLLTVLWRNVNFSLSFIFPRDWRANYQLYCSA